MACLYPRWMVIREALKPSPLPYDMPLSDPRAAKIVMVPCHHCEPCLRRRAQEWHMRIRCEHDYGDNLQFLMTTISFSDANMIEKYTRTCLAAKMRKAFDVFRKRFGFTPKYVFFSEYGDSRHNKHRFHLHGFLVIPKTVIIKGRRRRLEAPVPYKEIHALFNKFFGYCWVEPLTSAAGITYAVKYITKTYIDRCEGNGLIISSVNFGLGYAARRARYINSPDWRSRQRLVTFSTRRGNFRYPLPLTFKRMAERITGIRYRYPAEALEQPLPLQIGSRLIDPDAPPSVLMAAVLAARSLHASLYPGLDASIPRKTKIMSSFFPSVYVRSKILDNNERFAPQQ